MDFGSGKGYLTFGVHDWLTRRGLAADVTGVEPIPLPEHTSEEHDD